MDARDVELSLRTKRLDELEASIDARERALRLKRQKLDDFDHALTMREIEQRARTKQLIEAWEQMPGQVGARI